MRVSLALMAFFILALSPAFAAVSPDAEILALQSDDTAPETAGYVADVRRESRITGEPLELLPVPPAVSGQQRFQDRFFNPELSREFKSRYEDQFGRTEVERNYKDQGAKYGSYDSATGQWIDVRQQTEQQSEFGNFMGRRLFEYHLENYSKTEPKLRAAYEIKEKVTNYELEVAPGYSMKSHYSLAGNYVDMQFNNPFVGSRSRIEMDPRAVGPTEIRETRIAMDRKISSSIRVEAHYQIIDGIGSLVTTKALTPAADLSLTGSTYLTQSGYSTRETLGLLGYHLRF